MSMDLSKETIGFIGGGNMARAIAVPLIEKGILKASNVWVSARTAKTLDFWKGLGVNTELDNVQVVKSCKTIILAVKPQFLQSVTISLIDVGWSDSNKLLISVIVGFTINRLKQEFGRVQSDLQNFRIVRTLPNTPLAVGEGITVYCCPPSMDGSEDCVLVESIFSKIGMVEKIDENLMNAVSALSGSGPAYAYLMTEALADGAVKNGVPRALATKLAAQMFVGAGKMVLETGKHPGQLKDEVCSPGGTTIAGVYALETGGVRGSLIDAIDSAVKRAKEISS